MMTPKRVYLRLKNVHFKVQSTVRQLKHRGKRLSLELGIASLLLGLAGAPGRAAEQVYFNVGALEFSVSVQDLQTFAKEGKAYSDLALIVNRLTPDQRTRLRNLLSTQYKFSPVLMSRFFYSPLGERLLTYMGELIQLKDGQNGFYGIRAALIQASADPEGLSAINFIRKFPTNIQLNTGRIRQQMSQVSTLLEETEALVARLKQLALASQAAESTIDFAQLPDPKTVGQYKYVQQTKKLFDAARQREFLVQLYLPELPIGAQAAVVVITNGIGTKLDRYDYLAEHLASHGFAIAILQHPDSDDRQQQAFLQGLSGAMFKSTAYLDRPQDVTYLLNELERLNSSEFGDRLDLQKVGIFGNSFGGDTALSLAGAEINFDQLEKDCSAQKNLVKLSLLVQCHALDLPRRPYTFRDRRIKAASVLFPGSSSLFGQTGLSQIQIPVLWGAVSKDLFSPLVLDQMPAFNWLGTPDKYLVVATGIDHLNLNFYALRNLKTLDKEAADAVTIKEPEIVKSYVKALNLAFFQVYLVGNTAYRPYLSASYAQSISEASYNLLLLKSLSEIYSDGNASFPPQRPKRQYSNPI